MPTPYPPPTDPLNEKKWEQTHIASSSQLGNVGPKIVFCIQKLQLGGKKRNLRKKKRKKKKEVEKEVEEHTPDCSNLESIPLDGAWWEIFQNRCRAILKAGLMKEDTHTRTNTHICSPSHKCGPRSTVENWRVVRDGAEEGWNKASSQFEEVTQWT